MRRLHTEIGFNHGRILDDLARSALRDFCAFLDHDDVLRYREDLPHHVLHDEASKSDFLLNLREQGDRIAEFVRRQTREDSPNPEAFPYDDLPRKCRGGGDVWSKQSDEAVGSFGNSRSSARPRRFGRENQYDVLET